MDAKTYRAQVSAALAANLVANIPPPAPDWAEELKLLSDPAHDPDNRKAALASLQAGMFLGSAFAPYLADFLAALRKIAVAPESDADLRKGAFDTLANLKDDFAREQLSAGLQGKGPLLLPAATALGMLARDDHGDAVPIARALLSSDADVHLRAQAVRVLAADPTAAPLLSSILENRDEFRAVRQASAVALNGLAPDTFSALARNIRDRDDFADIKATVGNALDRTQE